MFKVKKECCDQCLFGKNKIISNERRKEILGECRKNDSYFVCHKSESVCCHGSHKAQIGRMSQVCPRKGWVEFVE